MRFYRVSISKKAQRDMAFIMFHDPNGILAAIFSALPLELKQHSIRVGAVAGVIAENMPDHLIPEGMTRWEYANAVRYGGFYHDIGAYLSYNQWAEYPVSGKNILERELNQRLVREDIRRVILQTVGCAGEYCDGNGYPGRLRGDEIPLHAGICAISDAMDMIIDARRRFYNGAVDAAVKYVEEQTGIIFLPEAAKALSEARRRIFEMYWSWKISPPLWNYNDLKPVSRPYEKIIG